MITLEQAFEGGLLVRTSDGYPNLVHLIRALASLAGVSDLDGSEPVQSLKQQIGPSEHLIFILVDGLGMNLVGKLPESSFIRRHLKGELHSTCPSTTACALTSVATAQYPNRHAVTGWFTYLPDRAMTVSMLPFQERITHQPLVQRNIRPQDLLPAPSICPRMSRRTLTVVPAPISTSPYNLYSRGGTAGIGYQSIHHAMNEIIEAVTAAKQPTYTHLYMPEIDSLCHKIGAGHANVLPLVLSIDSELHRLADELEGDARLVVSADHGLIDVPRQQQTLLQEGDTLLEMLLAPPTGDARMPIFHLREGKHEAFVAGFNERFGEGMALAGIDEVERLGLLGPGPLSPIARARFGDFIAFPHRATTLSFHSVNKPMGELFVGVHGGLSSEEVMVPLVIA